MAINVQGLLTGGAVGVADVGLEYWDTKSARTGSFKTATDLGRLGMVVGGLALAQFMPRYARLGETVAIAAMPLLVKSVAKAVAPSLTSQRYAPMQRHIVTPAQRVQARAQEFDTVRMI